MIRLLAGDIGGTHTRLALFDLAGEGPRDRLDLIGEERFASRGYDGLEEIVLDFVGSGSSCRAACFGIAGPVRDGFVRTTNLPWEIDGEALADATRIPRVVLLNDLEALAWGIGELSAGDLEVLAEGVGGGRGNLAVIAAGTGLGQAGAAWDGVRHRPFASEGGHASFAPGDELEAELLAHLRRRFAHVSWERVVSGPGLVNLYRFLCEQRGEEPAEWLEREIEGGDPAAAITRAAREGSEPPCRAALDLFVRLYGAEAGNLALKLGATGGVYLGGGIAPKIRRELAAGAFLEAFRDKGRMRPLLERVPVSIVLDDRAALRGAARRAALAATRET